MDRENHFIPKLKLSNFISTITSQKSDKVLLSSIQAFSEKFITDITNRAILLSKHRNSKILEVEDLLFTLEKEFDIILTERVIVRHKRLPDDKHTARMAEITRNK